MKIKVVGFESANGFVKVYHDMRELVYPNTTVKAVKENFKVSDKFNEDTVYEVGGRRVNVGSTRHYISSSMESISRYGTAEYKIESLVAVSQFVKSNDKVVAVTGIPSIHYQDREEAEQLIRDNLVGQHTLTKNGATIKFEIIDVLVTLQPLASFFYAVMDEHGNLDIEMENRFFDTDTLVIDIGWGTTDMTHLFSGGIKDYFHIKTSMVDAYKDIAECLIEQAKVDKRKLKNADIELLHLEKEIRVHNVYRYSNETYAVEPIATTVFDNIAQDILIRAKAKADFDKFTTVIFTGGGSKTLEFYLKKHLINKETGALDENIFFMMDSQTANAKGYYIYGKYIQQEVQV